MNTSSILYRKALTARRLDPLVIAWLIPAWLLIGLSTLLIALLPLRTLVRLFGRNLGALAFVPCVAGAQRRRAEQIHQVIAVAARYAPFRSDCYPQAIATLALCRLYRLPYALHFGAVMCSGDTGRREMKAHAWVVSGPIAICGGNASFAAFGVLSCFVPPRICR